MTRMDAKREHVKVRPCLGCDADVLSEGPWNRICDPCAAKPPPPRRATPSRLHMSHRQALVACEGGET